jgi:hypothetical protein
MAKEMKAGTVFTEHFIASEFTEASTNVYVVLQSTNKWWCCEGATITVQVIEQDNSYTKDILVGDVFKHLSQGILKIVYDPVMGVHPDIKTWVNSKLFY